METNAPLNFNWSGWRLCCAPVISSLPWALYMFTTFGTSYFTRYAVLGLAAPPLVVIAALHYKYICGSKRLIDELNTPLARSVHEASTPSLFSILTLFSPCLNLLLFSWVCFTTFDARAPFNPTAAFHFLWVLTYLLWAGATVFGTALVCVNVTSEQSNRWQAKKAAFESNCPQAEGLVDAIEHYAQREADSRTVGNVFMKVVSHVCSVVITASYVMSLAFWFEQGSWPVWQRVVFSCLSVLVLYWEVLAGGVFTLIAIPRQYFVALYTVQALTLCTDPHEADSNGLPHLALDKHAARAAWAICYS